MYFSVGSEDRQLPHKLLKAFGEQLNGQYLTLIAQELNYLSVRSPSWRRMYDLPFLTREYFPWIPRVSQEELDSRVGPRHPYWLLSGTSAVGDDYVTCGTVKLPDPLFQEPDDLVMQANEIDEILIYDFSEASKTSHLLLNLACVHTAYDPYDPTLDYPDNETRSLKFWNAVFPQGEILCWLTVGQSIYNDLRVNKPRVYAGDHFKIFDMVVTMPEG